MAFTFYGFSEKSPHHRLNEDSFKTGDNFVVISDGMGGEQSGEIASKIVVDCIYDYLKNMVSMEQKEEEIRDSLKYIIKEADAKIQNYIAANPDSFGMGATVIVAFFQTEKLILAWVGDSHCFLYRDGSLVSLSKDHSYVENLIDEGKISREESFQHPQNNLVTRYIGGGEEWCKPDIKSSPLKPDDVVILCSDGLSGYCREEEIENECETDVQPKRLIKRLSRQSKFNGCDDDLTIVVATTREGENNILQRCLNRIFRK
ncbi:MAG: serine/threonine-protein phosphatase [Muribaculaceae bacterium]|nr:serine/threonine-protein phosphatase [Muribaculaceae bacterium]